MDTHPPYLFKWNFDICLLWLTHNIFETKSKPSDNNFFFAKEHAILSENAQNKLIFLKIQLYKNFINTGTIIIFHNFYMHTGNWEFNLTENFVINTSYKTCIPYKSKKEKCIPLWSSKWEKLYICIYIHFALHIWLFCTKTTWQAF